MSDLVSRLLEAIGETERLANGNEKWWAPPDLSGTVDTGIGGIDLDVKLPSYAAHIAHNDPSSVFRRCAGDRRTVEQWQRESADPYEGLSDDELHQRHAHPAYEYETTEGQRKAWPYVDDPPWDGELNGPGKGWELNITSRHPDAWERFEYTEERYWRRLRPGGPEKRAVHVPYFIRNLAEAYGLEVTE